jgi:polyphosphate kinase
MHTTPELSWLRFNRRVLQQTRRPDFPVLERLRFLAIWSSNLDEFFAARVSRLFLEARGSEAYLAVLREVKEQKDAATRMYGEFLRELEGLGTRILGFDELTRAERRYFGAFLAEEVAPKVDIIRVEALQGVRSRALYFASGNGVLQYLIRVPEHVPRLLEVPGRDGAYVRLGELLRLRADLFLATKHATLHELRVVRLAAIDKQRVDWDDLPSALERRLDGRVSHLEVERGFPAHWTEAIRLALGLEPEEVFRVDPPLDLRFVCSIVDAGAPEARFPPLPVQRPQAFLESPFEAIDAGDLLLFHPYQSYEAVEAFARAAADDPDVTEIRATLYRVGDQNVIANALIAAARAGKDVAVLLEARARFDELTDIEWALRFQGAGVRVLQLPEKKVHAKAFWARRGGREYAHLGTGNYNTRNGRLYTDLSLFTCDPRLTSDTKAFFDALEEGAAPELDHLKTGAAIRELLVDRIRAEAHPRGHVVLKCNHLTDAAVLAALDDAARAGARVDLLVRTTLPEVSPLVHARSLVGRFLEHARAAAFRCGGDWEVWAGSCDVMPRSFDRRRELLFPVLDPRAKRRVLAELRRQLSDDVNAFELGPDGSQTPRWGGTRDAQRPDGHEDDEGAAPRYGDARLARPWQGPAEPHAGA